MSTQGTERDTLEEGAARRANRRGLVIVFTGNGKGKTTAAMGMALRAVGHGQRVLMLQFIKKNTRCGELTAIQRLAPQFEVVRHGQGFTWRAKDEAHRERHREAAIEALGIALEAITGGQHDMIILDEICTAVLVGLLSADDVLALLAARPPSLHLVLTGRGAPPALVDRADTVTEMYERKHHYHAGVAAQKGIEF